MVVRTLILSTLLSCCATTTINIWTNGFTPKFKSVDPEAKPFVDEYVGIARTYGVTFYNPVPVGFEDINKAGVVGECNYGLTFREIDLDSAYWATFNNIKRTIAIYHELGHCMCGRSHGYEANGEYGDDDSSSKDPSKKDGFFRDGCPISIRYPYVLEETCFLNHYNDYMDDLFKNCEPY